MSHTMKNKILFFYEMITFKNLIPIIIRHPYDGMYFCISPNGPEPRTTIFFRVKYYNNDLSILFIMIWNI